MASNRAVAHYLEEITGNRILIPELNQVMGAGRGADRPRKLGARQRAATRTRPAAVPSIAPRPGIPAGRAVKKSVAMRTQLTRREFLSKSDAPLVWRNLFFPAEILNALGVRMLTMETYAALQARNGKRGCERCSTGRRRKGFSAETCSFLRVLEGDDQLAPARLRGGHQRAVPAGRASAGRPGPRPRLPRSLPSRAHAHPARTTARSKASPPGWRRRWPTWSGRWA